MRNVHLESVGKKATQGLAALPVIDLFAGAGGLSLGAARAGFELRLAVENDPFAYRSHAANFPGSRHSAADVSTLSGDSLLAAAGVKKGELAGIVGGPPCQGFSTIGRRQVGDHRNLLFHKFFSLVQESRPKFFLAENVPGIMNPAFRKIREDALAQLSGYELLEPIEVMASDYGAPTSRKRVLFFGYLKDEMAELAANDFRPSPRAAKVTVGQALCGLPKSIRPAWDTDEKGWRKVRGDLAGAFGVRTAARLPMGVGHPIATQRWKEERVTSGCLYTHHEPDTVRRFERLEPGRADEVSRGLRLDPEGFCPTLRAGTDSRRGSYQAVRPIHPTEPRVITPREAARLQGFPDWFRFDPTRWHSFRQIGNSVSPILAEAILSVVAEKLQCERESAR